jgi:hypothetical protein
MSFFRKPRYVAAFITPDGRDLYWRADRLLTRFWRRHFH